jgi:integrase
MEQADEAQAVLLAERAGAPLIRFHDIRHSAATNLLAEGMKEGVVSQMLGHSDFATTLRFIATYDAASGTPRL